ncbi:hypothetical protein ACRALDRAFT_2025738 [Sodiomyces alcalophilus JCM 7366]|uniref:uncharacterized protein n=1 Tax=Sodiomyces alcalophilus JCM 7366 TaxID=591952 RepID=UPI0039B49963
MSSTTPDPTASPEPPREDGDLFGGSPIWVAIPLVLFIIATVLVTCIIFCRRRRRLGVSIHPNWDHVDHRPYIHRAHHHYERPYADPTLRPTGVPLYGRRTGWSGWPSRSAEGLNEFGEAPPVYEAKPKDPGQSLAGGSRLADHPGGPSAGGAADAVELDQIRRTTNVDPGTGLPPGWNAPGSTTFTPLTPPAPTHRPGGHASPGLAPPGPVPAPSVPPPDYGSMPTLSTNTRDAPLSETASSSPPPPPPPQSSSVPVIQSPPPAAPRTS